MFYGRCAPCRVPIAHGPRDLGTFLGCGSAVLRGSVQAKTQQQLEQRAWAEEQRQRHPAVLVTAQAVSLWTGQRRARRWKQTHELRWDDVAELLQQWVPAAAAKKRSRALAGSTSKGLGLGECSKAGGAWRRGLGGAMAVVGGDGRCQPRQATARGSTHHRAAATQAGSRHGGGCTGAGGTGGPHKLTAIRFGRRPQMLQMSTGAAASRSLGP